MLRAIKSPHPGVRVMAFAIDGADGSPAATVGADDLSSITDNGVGDYTLNFKEPFKQIPSVFVCSDTAVGIGAEAYLQADPTISAARILLKTGASVATDGIAYVIVVGMDSAIVESGMPHDVKTTRTKARMLLIKVNADASAPAITIGKRDATLTRAGVGDYTLTFRNSFGLAPICVGLLAEDDDGSVTVTSRAVGSVHVRVADGAAAASEKDFYLVVLGWDAQTSQGKLRRPIQGSQLHARLLPMFLNVASGTPSLSTGTKDATVVDVGTGEHTLTWAKPFSRAPVILACPVGVAYAACVGSVTAGAIKTYSNTSKADSNGVSLLVVGFDSSAET